MSPYGEVKKLAARMPGPPCTTIAGGSFHRNAREAQPLLEFGGERLRSLRGVGVHGTRVRVVRVGTSLEHEFTWLPHGSPRST
jgi:hypothetical protein